jgi:hypothetical protein
VRIGVAAIVTALAIASAANAGTYVINNCPSAPTPNGDAGSWTIFSSPQADEGSCGGGPGNWIGPASEFMSPNTLDGVSIAVPAGSGITIHEAKLWWSVPNSISGATTFAVASANGAVVFQGATPYESSIAGDELILPSTTTSLVLADYCSSDDGPSGCTFGGADSPNLSLYGAQLTLGDDNLPAGAVTAGALAGPGPMAGVQSLAFNAADADTGVRRVALLVDGQDAAQNDYISSCPYTNFVACPPSVSDTISWNTASVADGQHSVELVVEDAAQNTAVIYDGVISTQNAPVNVSPPIVGPPSDVLAGVALSIGAGTWSAPVGAGATTYSYQWQDCDREGNDCHAIPGAEGSSYTVTSSEVGDTLRALITASDSDGSASLASAASTVVASPPPGASGTLAALSASPVGSVPNGMGASEGAQLHLAGHAAISRSFDSRAFTVTGQLVNGAGAGIAGATLEVGERMQGSDSVAVIAHATTGPNGSFSVHVAAGPSRLVLIEYRAFSTDPAYTAQGRIKETVAAGVQMHVTPRHTSASGSIVLAGRVSGPIPRGGVVVELLVHYRGHWEPLRTPRTNVAGRFRMTYQFQGALGRFPFRAQVFGGQSGFPYAQGESPTVDVSTN